MYSDDLGNNIILTSKLAQGGEGEIYCVKNKPKLVAKIYFKEKINSELFEKIKVLCELSNSELSNFAILPKKILYENNQPVGYLMQKLTGYHEIHQLYGLNDKQKYYPNKNYDFMVNVAYNFIYALEVLHKNNIIIGDVNQGNIMINEQGSIKLVDCDSYQIKKDGRIYYCNVGKPEYTASEFQSKKYRNLVRSEKSDIFSAAIIAFQILVFARHPYSSVEAPSDIPEAIKNNAFYYGNKNKKKTPIYSDIYNNLSPELKDAFNNIFNSKPDNRLSATEFRKILFDYKNNLVQCKNNKRHFHLKNENCVWCELEKNGAYYFNSLKEFNNNKVKKEITSAQNKTKQGYSNNIALHHNIQKSIAILSGNIFGFVFGSITVLCKILFNTFSAIFIALFSVFYKKLISPIIGIGFLWVLATIGRLLFS